MNHEVYRLSSKILQHCLSLNLPNEVIINSFVYLMPTCLWNEKDPKKKLDSLIDEIKSFYNQEVIEYENKYGSAFHPDRNRLN